MRMAEDPGIPVDLTRADRSRFVPLKIPLSPPSPLPNRRAVPARWESYPSVHDACASLRGAPARVVLWGFRVSSDSRGQDGMMGVGPGLCLMPLSLPLYPPAVPLVKLPSVMSALLGEGGRPGHSILCETGRRGVEETGQRGSEQYKCDPKPRRGSAVSFRHDHVKSDPTGKPLLHRCGRCLLLPC